MEEEKQENSESSFSPAAPLEEVIDQTEEKNSESIKSSSHLADLQNTTARYPGLQAVLDLFIVDVAPRISKFLYRKCEVTLSGFYVDSFDQYLLKLPVISIFNLFFIKSHQQYGLIHFPQTLLNQCIHILYGGQGGNEDYPYNKIGFVGQKVILHLLKILFEVHQHIWSEVSRFEFEFIKTYSNPKLITKIPRREMFVVMRYLVQLADFSQEFDIALPCSLMDQLKPKLLIYEQPPIDSQTDPGWQQMLRKEVLNAMITVTAKFPVPPMSLKQILQLKEGDMLPLLAEPKEAELTSGDKKLYKVAVGISHGQRVVKILESF